jgi:uracil-DNA glycosylase
MTLDHFLPQKPNPFFRDRTEELRPLMEGLHDFPSSTLVFNQYENARQIHNLSQYLTFHLNNQANILLLGEAPGYKGCRASGIPFTSGEVLAYNPIYADCRSYYQYSEIQAFKENTSNIFYQFFNAHEGFFNRVLLWNAFPFHPHKENNNESNRSPTMEELDLGGIFLLLLLQIFSIQQLITIGEKAKILLQRLQKSEYLAPFEIITIRHPSYGGKQEFNSQLDAFFIGLNSPAK